MDLTKFNAVVDRCREIMASGKTKTDDNTIVVTREVDDVDGAETFCIAYPNEISTTIYELGLFNNTLWELVQSDDEDLEYGANIGLETEEKANQQLDEILTDLTRHDFTWI